VEVHCPIYHPPPPSEAGLALRAGDYAQAVALYQAVVAKTGQDEAAFALSNSGLVDALVAQGRSVEAVTVAFDALQRYSKNAVLLDAYGRVRLRRGEMGEAATALYAARGSDPCNARVHYDLARYLHLDADYASEQKELQCAHSIEPDSAAITYELKKLSTTRKNALDDLNRRLAQTELAPQTRSSLQNSLGLLRVQDQGSCEVLQPIKDATIPLTSVGPTSNGMYAVAIDIALAGRRKRLELDTGASGITLSRSVAKVAGIHEEAKMGITGIGDQGPSSVSLGHVADIKIGSLELRNCLVEITDKTLLPDVDGSIGADTFSSFVLTLDMPDRNLRLTPLPPFPDDGASRPASPFLDTESELMEHPPLRDRYIPAEMATWTKAFRSGHKLYLPTSINGGKNCLFLMDTGSPGEALIAMHTAKEVTSLSPSGNVIGGANGEVNDVSTAERLDLQFAGLRENLRNVPAINLGAMEIDGGSDVAGIIGFGTLRNLVIRIDYRDSLVQLLYPHK
jgi:predicted aspartyl protease